MAKFANEGLPRTRRKMASSVAARRCSQKRRRSRSFFTCFRYFCDFFGFFVLYIFMFFYNFAHTHKDFTTKSTCLLQPLTHVGAESTYAQEKREKKGRRDRCAHARHGERSAQHTFSRALIGQKSHDAQSKNKVINSHLFSKRAFIEDRHI